MGIRACLTNGQPCAWAANENETLCTACEEELSHLVVACCRIGGNKGLTPEILRGIKEGVLRTLKAKPEAKA